jgi:hypothetical protein
MHNMNRFHAILIIAIVAFALGCAGCHTSQALPAGSRLSAAAASAQNPYGALTLASGPTQPAKHSPRDSEFAVYRNPDYGISFRYPRYYALVEASQSEDPGFLRNQQELAATQPGAILVATVLIPDDAYPNTTFRSGSLQFVVHPGSTPEACRAYAAPNDPDLRSAAGSATIHGIPFDWGLIKSAAATSHVENVDYAGFSNGTCYEFLVKVEESNSAEPDSGVKPADTSKILRALEKIVSSFQVRGTVAAHK